MRIIQQEPILRYGKWLPDDPQVMEAWLKNLIDEVSLDVRPLHPVIEEFKELIGGDAQIYLLFHQMFTEVPTKPPYDKNPIGKPQVRNYKLMLRLFSHIMTRAPEFSMNAHIGFPINAILDWPMGTGSGFAAFLNDKVNAQIRKMLNEWARYLRSKDSTYVLSTDPNDWFGEAATNAMPDFKALYVCDAAAPHYGFASWDDFFTRQFRPGVRLVAAPADDNIVVNACESVPYRITRNAKARDHFWIKAQLYSLEFMLAGDALVPRFTSGTVYQAYLTTLSYHRWHSPVSGRVVKAYVQPGTYYSEVQAVGFPHPKPEAQNYSQSYLTEVATRAIIFIQADNPL